MRAVLIAVATLCAVSAAAQESENVKLPFRPGAYADLTVIEERTLTQIADGKQEIKQGRVTGRLEYRALDDGQNSGTWTTESVESGGVTLRAGDPMAAAMLVGIPVGIIFNEAGSPLDFADWRALSDGLRSSLASMTDVNPDSIETVMRMYEGMEPASRVAALLKEPVIIGGCQGHSLSLGEVIRAEGALPNPLGGEPLPADISARLVSVDRAAGIAEIHIETSIDPQAAAALVSVLAQRFAREGGQSAAEFESSFANGLQISTRLECTIELETGIARRVRYEQIGSIDGLFGQTDLRVLTLQDRGAALPEGR